MEEKQQSAIELIADLMRQATPMTGIRLDEAIQAIDAKLGAGYAKANPGVLASFLSASTRQAQTDLAIHAGETFVNVLGTHLLALNRLLAKSIDGEMPIGPSLN